MSLDLSKLFVDVFDPQPAEVVTIALDLPHDAAPDNEAWQSRRAMAAQWRDEFEKLGRSRSFTTNPLLTYAATGGHNQELPSDGEMGGTAVVLEEVALSSTLLLFMTEFSATAPLTTFCEKKADLRAASLPGLERRMENSGLAADYAKVGQRCRTIAKHLEGATRLDIQFSTGHRCEFDLRYRVAEAEDGNLPRDKKGDRIINLPSGETFIVPYEGERKGEPSTTKGQIPVHTPNGLVLLQISENRVVSVEGDSPEASTLRALFEADPACANVAEVAFGCNDRAEVTGNILEDEKAGFHWAYGRSEHLGGTVGPSAFRAPENVVHQDIVYAKGHPIQVAEAVIVRGAERIKVMRDGEYVVF